MTKFSTGWYLLYTRPRQEAKVANELAEKSVQVYLPYTKLRRRWSDRIKTIDTPLFPSYVFVHLKNMHEFYHGINMEGSCAYVKFGNEVARVSDTVINAVRLIEHGAENVEVSDVRFTPGQQLLIQEGPLCGLTCEVVQHKGKDKILVRVYLLQRSILADMPAHLLMQC